jgi:hypothetical protein
MDSMCCNCDRIKFAKLKEADFGLMYKWLNNDFIKEWFGKDGIHMQK